MLDREQAKQVALSYLSKKRSPFHPVVPFDLVVIDGATREEPWGWVFFWNDRRYVEGGDWMFKVSGNFPIAVARSTGASEPLVYVHGVQTLDDAIKKFVATLGGAVMGT